MVAQPIQSKYGFSDARAFAGAALRCGFALFALLIFAPSDVALAQGRDGNWMENFFTYGTARDTGHQTPSQRRRNRAERAAERAKMDVFLETREAFFSPATIEAMGAAIARYRQIVARGGWRRIPNVKRAWLRPGVRDERVPLLRRRLWISGDYRGRGTNSTAFDNTLAEALKRFQIRHGLRPNGVVDTRTLAALNRPADERLATLQINAHRIRAFQERVQEAGRYVVVNVPSFELQAVRGNVVELHSKVIAGRDRTQTPSIDAKIKGVNFLPYWRVPDSIAQRDVIPTILRNPEYLQQEGIRVLKEWGGEEIDPTFIDWRTVTAEQIKFRQDPGERNALGLIRIDMPNDEIVYMHDTPLKQLFGRSVRSFSAGCVRVQNIRQLAEWLISETPEWNRARMDSVIYGGIQEDVKLAEYVPVLFVYLTAWASGSGEAHFRDDLYRRDGLSNVAFARYEDEPELPRALSP